MPGQKIVRSSLRMGNESHLTRSDLLRLFISRQQRDKTVRLPHLDIIDDYISQRLLDGFLIVRALDIFRADPVSVKINR